MNNSSQSAMAERTAISLLSTTKQDLRRIKKEEPKTYAEIRTLLISSQLEAQRIDGIIKLALKKLNSL